MTGATTRTRVLIAVVATAIVFALALLWQDLRAARAARDASVVALDDAESVAMRVRVLRATSTRITDRPPPEPDLVARLHSALRAAGIDERRLASVSTSRPEPVRGSEIYRRITAPITLDSMRPPELARFLAEWLDADDGGGGDGGGWGVASITLSHEGPTGGARGATVAADDRYTARLVLENIHVDALASSSRGDTP